MVIIAEVEITAVDTIFARMKVKRDTDENLTTDNPVLLDGELVYNTTNGNLKIGTQSLHYNSLPALNKQFQNVITVSKSGSAGYADFICSDSQWDSDTACIQAAITKLSETGGGLLVIFGGTYDVSAFVTCNSNISVEGYGNVIFNVSGGDNTPVFQFSGSTVFSTTLTADADMFDMTLSLTQYSGVQPGDLLTIFNTDVWTMWYDDPQYTGEMYQITKVASNVVTLNQPLIRAYLSSNTTVRINRPIQVCINNIKFIGPGATENVAGLGLTYCVNSDIQNCTFNLIGRRSIVLSTCFNTVVNKCSISNSQYSSTGYGISISEASAYIYITNNHIENCRHCVSAGTSNLEALNRDIHIEDNTLVGLDMPAREANVIDSHPMTINFIVTGNSIYPGFDTTGGWAYHAIQDGTQHCIFSNNYVYGGGAFKRRYTVPSCHSIVSNNDVKYTRGRGLYTYAANGAGNPVSLVITGNLVEDCTGTTYGTAVELDAEDYKLVIISDNTIDGCTLSGISVKQQGDMTNHAVIKIVDNVITNTQQNGIIVSRVSASTTMDVDISNNTITDVNQSAGTYNGIRIIDLDGCKIKNNTVKNYTGTAYAGIREATILGGTASDNNEIIGNTINGATTAITKIGSNTVVRDNSGYKTEATGTATIATSGTSVVVTHGLAAAPTRVIVTPGSNINCWVVPGSITATQFTISSTEPASDTTVYWSAEVR